MSARDDGGAAFGWLGTIAFVLAWLAALAEQIPDDDGPLLERRREAEGGAR